MTDDELGLSRVWKYKCLFVVKLDHMDLALFCTLGGLALSVWECFGKWATFSCQ